MSRRRSKADVQVQIGALSDLPYPELVDRWGQFYNCQPPKGVRRDLLIRGISYQIQIKAFGGLKPATIRRMRSMNQNRAKVDVRAETLVHPQLVPGARLIREWNDVMHHVDVTSDGFIWNGLKYGSLSANARDITGAHWSGPRFFGLTSARAS